jgi:DNA-directed RNA polymerase subunit F
MLRTNLATRPFYNQRGVRLALGAVAAIAIGLTTYNALQVWRLNAQSAGQRQVAERNEREARELRDKARTIRQSLDRVALDALQASAREANELIDRRAFSWTDLFNRFEATLPADVRIASVQPQTNSDGRMLVAVTVQSRRVEDLDQFIEALEKTGAFSEVLSRQESAEDDGTLKSFIQGFYGPPAASAVTSPSAVPPPPASDPGKGAPGNRTAAVIAGAGGNR